MAESSPRSRGGAKKGTVPKGVATRLSLYLREVERLQLEERATVSSTELGKRLGLSDAQVRKDLARFGPFGYPGIGYRCKELGDAIRGILGTDTVWHVALVGLGNLGRALLRYGGFQNQGFRIVAAFDELAHLIGQTIEGIEVFGPQELDAVIARDSIRLAIIAVPAAAAQSVADQLVTAGVEGILNFAPARIAVPEGVALVRVDLAMELEQLSFAVRQKEGQSSSS